MPQLWPNRISEAHPELLHSLGTFLPHGVHKVPVAVQCEGHRIVARVRGNRLGIVPGMDGRHNVGVTEIMKAIVREIGVFQHFIQVIRFSGLAHIACNVVKGIGVLPQQAQLYYSCPACEFCFEAM